MNLLPALTGETASFPRDLYLGCGAAVSGDCKLILKGGSRAMQLKSDYLVYYPEDAYEAQNRIEEHAAEAERLRRYIIRYDTIRPAHPELPYGQGKRAFKAPAEWLRDQTLKPGSPQIAAGAGAFFGRTALPHSYPDDFPS